MQRAGNFECGRGRSWEKFLWFVVLQITQDLIDLIKLPQENRAQMNCELELGYFWVSLTQINCFYFF